MNRIMSLWHKIPEQIRRLLIPFLIIIIGYLVARWILVPSDFGLLGHYRASSITINLQKEIRYAGAEVCVECHDQIVAAKKQGYHRGVACEACHGPALVAYSGPWRISSRPLHGRERSVCSVTSISLHGLPVSRRSSQIPTTRRNHVFPATVRTTRNHRSR